MGAHQGPYTQPLELRVLSLTLNFWGQKIDGKQQPMNYKIPFVASPAEKQTKEVQSENYI